jgi:hypothetical protein
VPTPGGSAPTTNRRHPALANFFLDDLIVHKTLSKSLQKHCQTVFSRFLSMTIFIPAENTHHSEKPGQNPLALP